MMKRNVLGALLLLLLGTTADAATAIKNMPASSPLDGTEFVDTVQFGNDRRTTVAQLSAYFVAQMKSLLPTVALTGKYADLIGAPVAGVDYLMPGGNGSGLVGITAAQVGALAPTGNGSLLTGITAAQVGAATPAGVLALLGNYQTIVPSAAALRALVGTVGSTVQRLGFYAPGDGGDGLFVFYAASCTVDDGGSCLNANSGGSWQTDVSHGVKLELFGATGRNIGTLDDTAATQAAANLCVDVHLGAKVYRLTATVTIVCDGTHFIGSTAGDSVSQSAFHINHTGIGFRSYQDVHYEYIATYRDQPTPSDTAGTAWYPANNDFDFEHSGGTIFMHDVLTQNPTNQLYVLSGRMVIDGLRGQPFSTGIKIDGSYDTTKIQNYRAWPYWSVNQNVYDYQTKYGNPFMLGRVDGPEFDNIFVYHYSTMFHFFNSGLGIVSDMVANNLGDDGAGNYAFFFDGVSGATMSISNFSNGGTQDDTDGDPIGVNMLYMDAASQNNVVQFTNTRSTGYADSVIRILSYGNRVSLANTFVNKWSTTSINAPMFNVARGSYVDMLDNNPFIENGPSSGTIYGGTAYTLAPGETMPITSGSGFVDVMLGGAGPFSTFMMGGGNVTAVGNQGAIGSGMSTAAVNADGSTTGDQSATASGTVGLSYYGDYVAASGNNQVMIPGYRFYNNTGRTVTIGYKVRTMGYHQ